VYPALLASFGESVRREISWQLPAGFPERHGSNAGNRPWRTLASRRVGVTTPVNMKISSVLTIRSIK
jgi:hypothetical protein